MLQFYIGWIITAPALCVALLSIPAGALGNWVGRRRLLICSMALHAVVGVLPYFLTDLAQIPRSRIAVGVVEAVLMTFSTTLIGDMFKGEAHNRWLSAQNGVASVFAIFAILVAGIVGARDWHNVFLLYLMPVVFLVMVLAFTSEPDETEKLHDQTVQGRWSDIPWRSMALICAITPFGSVMFSAVQIKLPDAFKELGVLVPDGSYDATRGVAG